MVTHACRTSPDELPTAAQESGAGSIATDGSARALAGAPAADRKRRVRATAPAATGELANDILAQSIQFDGSFGNPDEATDPIYADDFEGVPDAG